VSDPHDLQDVISASCRQRLGVAEKRRLLDSCITAVRTGSEPSSPAPAVVVAPMRWCTTARTRTPRVTVPSPGFAMWLSGPSKTADIEQALVIGPTGRGLHGGWSPPLEEVRVCGRSPGMIE